MKLTTRELTKLKIEVAEKMGWRECRVDTVEVYCDDTTEPGFVTTHPVRGFRPGYGLRVELPNFPADENASKQLRETLAKEGWNCTIECYTDGTHYVSFWKDAVIKKDVERSAHADTLPVAICRAFLKVKRSK